GGEASNVAGPYLGLYRCDNVRTEQLALLANVGPAVAFRAPGFVEGAFALECALDELAIKLNLVPVDLRLRNYAESDPKSGKPYSTPDGLRQCYRQAAEA